MLDIALSERFKIYVINLLKELSNFAYYLFWIVVDPRKFVTVSPENIKKVLVICGGAIGDSYNVIGIMNSILNRRDVKFYFLTLGKNRKFVKNSKISLVDLEKAKLLIERREIDAAILMDPVRQREIFDKEMFFSLSKVKYISSVNSLRITPMKIKREMLPVLASRRPYPVRASGPETLLNLFRLLGFKVDRPIFYFTKEGEEFADRFFKKYIKKGERAVVIHPGAGKIVNALKEKKTPAHLWPEERWARLIDKLTSEDNIKVVLSGVKSEEIITKKIYEFIRNKKRVVYAVGKTPDIESFASILRRANATITLDTSTAHITSQVGTPAVIIYSSDSPKRIGPIDPDKKNIDVYHENKAHDCRRYACDICQKVHMNSISVEEIYSAAMSLIN